MEEKLEELKKQHMEITGQESANETNKLIQGTFPTTIGSTLKEINVSLFPNILYLINVLGLGLGLGLVVYSHMRINLLHTIGISIVVIAG